MSGSCKECGHDNRSSMERGYDETQAAIADRCGWSWIDGKQVPDRQLSVGDGQALIFLNNPQEVWVFWPGKLPGGMIFR